MKFSLLEIEWMDRTNWWISLGEIETCYRDGYLLLVGRSLGRFEFDLLWYGLWGNGGG